MELTKETMELSGRHSVLVETPADRLQDNLISMVRLMEDNVMAGIFVSINKPYDAVTNLLAANNIDTRRLFFVDCISHPSQDDLANVSFVSDISDLCSLSIEIARFIDTVPGEKFLLIDAVHTLWIYHTPEFIARFIQNLTERSYRANMKMVSFIVESDDNRLMRKLVPFFDGVMRVGN